jgi:hypothetical protein
MNEDQPKTPAPVARYVRKLSRNIVYPATEKLLARNDLYPCNKKGELLSSGGQELAQAPEPAPVAPNPDALEEEEVARMLELVEYARELGVTGPGRMKKETLLAKIAECEAILAAEKEAAKKLADESSDTDAE